MSTVKRITKHVAHDLIKYARSLAVTAPYYGEKSNSALEFYRQMNSPNLKANNASFEVSIKSLGVEDDVVPKIRAEFLNGDVMEVDTAPYSAMQLRELFYEAAKEAESSLASGDKKKK
jgi:hypothetical protein